MDSAPAAEYDDAADDAIWEEVTAVSLSLIACHKPRVMCCIRACLAFWLHLNTAWKTLCLQPAPRAYSLCMPINYTYAQL